MTLARGLRAVGSSGLTLLDGITAQLAAGPGINALIVHRLSWHIAMRVCPSDSYDRPGIRQMCEDGAVSKRNCMFISSAPPRAAVGKQKFAGMLTLAIGSQQGPTSAILPMYFSRKVGVALLTESGVADGHHRAPPDFH
jgi:hypothetical protein